MKQTNIFKFLITFVVITLTLAGCSQKNSGENEFFKKGDDFLENNQYSLALEQYKLSINEQPELTESYTSAADILILKTNFEQAKEILLSGVDYADNQEAIYERLALVEKELGNLAESLKYYEKTLGINPENKTAVLGKINILSLQEDSTALEEFVLKLDNIVLSQELLFIKGIVLYKTNNVESTAALELAKDGSNGSISDSSETALTNIEKINSNKNKLYNLATLTYQLLKHDYFEIALPFANELVEQNEYYETAFLYIGIINLETDNLDDAVLNLKRSSEINPDLLDTQIFLTQAYFKQNDNKNAKSTALNAKSLLKESNIEQFSELIDIVYVYDEYSTANNLLKDLSQRFTDKIPTKTRLLELKTNVRLKKYNNALKLEDELLKNESNLATSLQAEIYSFLGYANFKTGNKSIAIDQLKKAQTLDRAFALSYQFEGEILLDQENYLEAKEALERAVDLDITGTTGARGLLEQI